MVSCVRRPETQRSLRSAEGRRTAAAHPAIAATRLRRSAAGENPRGKCSRPAIAATRLRCSAAGERSEPGLKNSKPLGSRRFGRSAGRGTFSAEQPCSLPARGQVALSFPAHERRAAFDQNRPCASRAKASDSLTRRCGYLGIPPRRGGRSSWPAQSGKAALACCGTAARKRAFQLGSVPGLELLPVPGVMKTLRLLRSSAVGRELQ